MKETLDKILQDETESEELKRDSKNEAQKLKDAATDSGRELVKEKKRKANKEANKIIVKANENAETAIAGARQDVKIEYQNLTAIAGRNMKKAAEFIVERVICDI